MLLFPMLTDPLEMPHQCKSQPPISLTSSMPERGIPLPPNGSPVAETSRPELRIVL